MIARHAHTPDPKKARRLNKVHINPLERTAAWRIQVLCCGNVAAMRGCGKRVLAAMERLGQEARHVGRSCAGSSGGRCGAGCKAFRFVRDEVVMRQAG